MTIISSTSSLGGSSLIAGAPGLSAYQVWLAAGNTGYVSDFLASLVSTQHGPPGDAIEGLSSLGAAILEASDAEAVREVLGIDLANLQVASYRIVSSAYTAVAGDKIAADLSVGSFTIALPLSPTVGDAMTIADRNGSWLTHNLTVEPGSHAIGGLSDILNCNVLRATVDLVFVGGSIGWSVNLFAPIDGNIYGGYSFVPPTNAAIAAYILSLPTTLPSTAGKIWLNGGVLCVS